MADPDLPIKGGTRSSRPWDKGGPGLKIFFPPFGPQFGLKVRGGGSSPGPSPGSATVLVTTPDSPPLSYRRLVWVNVACVFNWVISRKVEREQQNMGRGRERGKEETFPSPLPLLPHSSLLLSSQLSRRPHSSLSIRRFWGKGERWKRKRESKCKLGCM